MSHNGDYNFMCHILKESYFKCPYILNQMEMHTIVEFWGISVEQKCAGGLWSHGL